MIQKDESRQLVILLSPVCFQPVGRHKAYSEKEAHTIGKKWKRNSLGGSYVVVNLDYVVVKR